jgi:hypothetical protein
MAIRNTRLILKNSDIVNRPLPSSLLKGEAIVNTADGIVFFSGITTSTSEWTPAGTGTTSTFFEVGSNLYDLRLRNKITQYQGQSGGSLSGKFLSGTTNGFVLADISDIAASVDSYTTGATWSPNTLTIGLNNGKPSVTVTIDTFNNIDLYGTTNVNGDLNVTGTTNLNGTSYYNNTASSLNEIVNYGLLTSYSQTNDVYVTGNTLTAANNDTPTQSAQLEYHGVPVGGPYFITTENTFTTGGTWNSGSTSIDFTRNDGGTYSVNLSNIDVNDTYVTGGTVTSLGDLDLFRNDGVTVTVPKVTYWTSGSTGSFSIKAINGSGLDSTGDRSVSWGNQTLASGNDSTSWGVQTSATTIGSTSSGYQTLASGQYSTSSGYKTLASGDYSTASGYYSTASGSYSQAEGDSSDASGNGSHAEGKETLASGQASHAEGVNTIASGNFSHSEGQLTTAYGNYSHSEGISTTASGNYSHSQGSGTTANGAASFASGIGSIAQTDGTFIHSENSIVTGQRSVVLGGQNITGSTNDTVYVPYLNLNLTPTLNNSNTEILSRNTGTGQVEYTALSAFTSLDTFVTGFTYNPASNTFTISQNQGQPDLTASIGTVSGLTISNLTAGRVVYVGAGGLLTDESGFEYNDGTNLLTVGNINVTNASGTTATIGQGGLVIGSGGSSSVPGVGSLTVHGDLTVFGDTTTISTSELYVEDPQITLNYNPTGDTSTTSIASGLRIQDGDGLGNDVLYTIAQMNTFTGGDITEYTGSTGYANRAFLTQLNDIIIRNTNSNNGAPDGVRVLGEGDILDSGQY